MSPINHKSQCVHEVHEVHDVHPVHQVRGFVLPFRLTLQGRWYKQVSQTGREVTKMGKSKFGLARMVGFSLMAAALAAVLRIGVAAPENLAFKAAGEGILAFDTGVVKGNLRATPRAQGIAALVDVKSGIEIARGGDSPGVLSYYRFLGANKRWGDAARDWPKSAKRLPDGAAEIHWPAQAAHPIAMTATYRWKSPDTLDLETVVKPETDVQDFEVFLSSYFTKDFRSAVYTSPTLHISGKPAFLAADVNPLVQGTYLAFPRDRRAAKLIFDGRWDYGPNPVHFSVARFLAAPLCVRRDDKNGLAAVIMSRPEDCFAIETPYNMDPPDGIANHYSMYLSLFGRDLRAGQSARALTRFVVGHGVSEQDAVRLYERFIAETGGKL